MGFKAECRNISKWGVTLAASLVATDICVGLVQWPFNEKDCANPVTATASNLATVFTSRTSPNFFEIGGTTPRQAKNLHHTLQVEMPEKVEKCYSHLPSSSLVKLTR